jgi:PHS family inorganic phosphate transporter-like MFS transporter
LYAAQSPHKSEDDPGYSPGIGLRNALFLLVGTNALGFICTFLVPETNQISLEDLSGENEENARIDAEQTAANNARQSIASL